MKKIKINQNNFIKKILIKAVRKLGFELIDQNNLTVPTSEKKLNDSLNILNEKNIVLPLGEVNIKRKVENLQIGVRQLGTTLSCIERACARENMRDFKISGQIPKTTPLQYS